MLGISRGPKPKGKVKIKWSANFAYAIGLLVTDGCLSNDGRHILFVSKDIEQINNFLKALKIKDIKIGKTSSESSGKKIWYPRVQFGDVLFYDFLLNIGLTPAKSKTMGAIKIPDNYFLDYLRGCFDGDGSSYSYWDKRWRSSFMIYICFVSASGDHITWLRSKIFEHLGINGHTSKSKDRDFYQLKYAKNDTYKIALAMYQKPRCLHLKRKRLKLVQSFAIISKSVGKY